MKNLALLALAFGAVAAQAQTLVYDNTTTTLAGGFSAVSTASSPTFGDALTLTAPGKLSLFSFAIFNPASSTGPMLTGTGTINFYDNTTPYTSGSIATKPLLGTLTFTLDFTNGGAVPGGLAPGFYSAISSNDLSAANIVLPQNVFVTQRYTQLTGTSTANGVIIAGNPTTGTSPNSFYINSAANAEGLYNLGTTPAQVFYKVTTAAPVPEPATMAALGLGAAALLRRRRKSA